MNELRKRYAFFHEPNFRQRSAAYPPDAKSTDIDRTAKFHILLQGTSMVQFQPTWTLWNKFNTVKLMYLAAVTQVILLVFCRGLWGPLCNGLVHHCSPPSKVSGPTVSLNSPLFWRQVFFRRMLNATRRRCGASAIPAPFTNVTTYLLTYLLI